MNVRFVDNELLRRALVEMATELETRGDDHAPFPLVRRLHREDLGDHVLTRAQGKRWKIGRKTGMPVALAATLLFNPETP